MKKGNLRSSALLLLTACIWGVAFVAQSVGMEYVEPFTFNFVRSILGGLVLIPCIFFLKREKKAKAEKVSEEEKKHSEKHCWPAGSAVVSPCAWQAISNRSASNIQPSEKPVSLQRVIL